MMHAIIVGCSGAIAINLTVCKKQVINDFIFLSCLQVSDVDWDYFLYFIVSVSYVYR